MVAVVLPPAQLEQGLTVVIVVSTGVIVLVWLPPGQVEQATTVVTLAITGDACVVVP